MAAVATPEPPTTTLLEAALALGFRVADQRWRARARCAGIDPEIFLPARGRPHDEAMRYCTHCEVRLQCLEAALDLGQRAVGIWGGSTGRERTLARRRGLTAQALLAELDRSDRGRGGRGRPG
jgi:WhiB family transcriptional regulator, redox-sensing transcriptional regulator